jgi:hypothetical protein
VEKFCVDGSRGWLHGRDGEVEIGGQEWTEDIRPYVRELLRKAGFQVRRADDALIFRLYDGQMYRDPTVRDMKDRFAVGRSRHKAWVFAKVLTRKKRQEARDKALARPLTSALPVSDAAAMAYNGVLYEDELLYKKTKDGWVATLDAGESPRTLPVVWDERASELMRRLVPKYGFEVANGKDAMRFHLIDGTEVHDPTFRQVLPLNLKHLPDVLCLEEDTTHTLRVRWRQRDPATPDEETAAAQAEAEERREDRGLTPEPPDGDKCERASGRSDSPGKEYTAKMELFFSETEEGIKVAADRPTPWTRVRKPDGGLERATRRFFTADRDEMVTVVLRRIAREHYAPINPEEDAICFRQMDMSVVRDISLADLMEANAAYNESRGKERRPSHEVLLVAFVRGIPRTMAPCRPTCLYINLATRFGRRELRSG